MLPGALGGLPIIDHLNPMDQTRVDWWRPTPGMAIRAATSRALVLTTGMPLDILGVSNEPSRGMRMGAAAVDKQHQVYALFNQRLKAEIKLLIAPALIEEHRQQPLGRHSDALERVLNFFRRPPRYAIYSRVPMREWQLIRMPLVPGAPPSPVDETVYRSEAAAIHAVFLRHVNDLMAA